MIEKELGWDSLTGNTKQDSEVAQPSGKLGPGRWGRLQLGLADGRAAQERRDWIRSVLEMAPLRLGDRLDKRP